MCGIPSRSPPGLTMRRIIGDLNNWLDSVNPNLGKKEWPGLEELWKSGDLHEKLVATNAKISSIERRWQVQKVFRFRRRTVLTTIMARCVCKAVHSHLRQSSLGNLVRLQLCSNRYSPYISRGQYDNARVVSHCICNMNRLTSVARRGWASIHASRYILMGTFLR